MKKLLVSITGIVLFVAIVFGVAFEDNRGLAMEMIASFSNVQVGKSYGKEIIYKAKIALGNAEKEEVVTGSGIDVVTGPSVEVTSEPIDFRAKFQKKKVKLYPEKCISNPLLIADGQSYDRISWSVNKKKYASVSKKGQVKLKKAGEGKKVKVYATVVYIRNNKEYKKKYSYEVLGQRRVKKVVLSGKQNYVFVGKELKIKASCKPEKASNKKLKWTSSNKKYATIDKKGVIHPKAAGAGKTVTFTAKTTDGSKIKECISVRIIDLNKPMIALTFDDGPSEVYTARIVNKLAEYDARATFFVLGSRLYTSFAGDILKKTVANGNEIASHTYSHKLLPGLSASQLQWESAQTTNRIKALTGTEAVLTRPPYGSVNGTVLQSIHTPMILWSIDTLDWKSRNANMVVSAVMGSVKDGDIILMHDLYRSTADAVDILVPALVKKGYQLVTVSELATYKKAKLQSGRTYSSIR